MVTPISCRKNLRVPELDCGMTGTIAAVLVPPTSFQVTGPDSFELSRLASQL